jgi:hypothetical protein
MKQVFYNPTRAEQEKKLKEKSEIEKEKRDKYLEALNKNRNFQKYVIEEIIDAEIEKASNISGQLAGFITANPEEVQRIMIAQKSRLDAIQDIKNKISNH